MNRKATLALLLVLLPALRVLAQPARVQFVNAAADSELPAIDIYVNGALEVAALPYGSATAFLDVPSNEPLDFALTAAGGNPAEPIDAFASAGYAPDSRRHIVVSGLLRPDRVDLPSYASDRDPSLAFHVTVARHTPALGGSFSMNLFHSAVDMPAFDWHVYSDACTRSKFVTTAWWGVDYGHFTDYVEGEPGSYRGYLHDTRATEADWCAERFTFLEVEGEFAGYANTVSLNLLTGWVVPQAGEDSLKVKVVHADGSVEDVGITIRDQLVSLVSRITKDGELPATVRLLGNYPNPFNPSTTIAYEVAIPSRVRLEVFDVLGHRVDQVLDQFATAGIHAAIWTSPPDAATGLYFARLTAGTRVATRSMLLLK